MKNRIQQTQNNNEVLKISLCIGNRKTISVNVTNVSICQKITEIVTEGIDNGKIRL